MTDKTLSEVIAEIFDKNTWANSDCITSTQIIRTLVKREELLREALEVSQWIITKGKAGKYEDINAVSKNEKALSLTDPNQPWKG